MTAHQRWARKVPISTRNSPTKPLRPGRPIDASIDDHEDAGEPGRDLLDALQLGDLVGVAPLVEEAEQDEERAGDDAVVDHLQDAPSMPWW